MDPFTTLPLVTFKTKEKYDVKIEDFLTCTCMDLITPNVACVIGPSVKPNYKIGKLKM
jgi:hypothetical protein